MACWITAPTFLTSGPCSILVRFAAVTFQARESGLDDLPYHAVIGLLPKFGDGFVARRWFRGREHLLERLPSFGNDAVNASRLLGGDIERTGDLSVGQAAPAPRLDGQAAQASLLRRREDLVQVVFQ